MSNEKLSTQAYKGTRDFYPEEMKRRNWFFGKIRENLELCAFDEYNGPMLESLALYAAKSGDELAREQTYNFTDRGGRDLAIRPEMTPTVARMVAAKMGELNYPPQVVLHSQYVPLRAPPARPSAGILAAQCGHLRMRHL